MVIPGSITTSGIRLGSGIALTLTEDDARAIAAQCPAVSLVAPVVRQGQQVIGGNNNWATSIQGVTPEFLTIRDLSLERGVAFTSKDLEAANKVALLGRTVAANLFPGGDPVGQIIRIHNVPLTVIGLLAPKGQSPTGQDQDDVVLIPLSTAKKRVLGASQASAGAVGTVMVQATGPSPIQAAQSQVRALLRQRHHLQPAQEDDFTIRNLEEGVRRSGNLRSCDGVAAGGHRVRFAGRRRHRHYEHHAGLGYGTHARDWLASGGGRDHRRHPSAVSGGGSRDFAGGWDCRDWRGSNHLDDHLPGCAMVDGP